jgi:low temperature requirement protein LtrA
MGISIRWRSLSFKRTHLAERLGLLTLIILGEGVIVLTKSVNYVVNSDGWTWTSFGQVLAVVLTIVS